MWRDSESDHDFLNFTEIADQIAALATNNSLLPISIGVFGTWGTGKSTVLKLVEGRLAQISADNPEAPVPIVVKFDAWMYQGFDDARAALMEVVASHLLQVAEEKKTLIDKAKEFAGRVNYFRGLGMIADFGLGIALGIPPGLLTRAGSAVSSIFAGSVTDAQYKELKGDAADVTRSLSELVRPAEKRTPPKEIAAFRSEFGELLEGLNTTLIVFIDNLDRCLPDVAIGTLEAIRLFLFMPRTAFVIAADEDMIRHSVAKHFNDPNASHVRDYLDKVIQVPMRVPQVGVQDIRAYMYSLFVSLTAPDNIVAVKERLLGALQSGWRGDNFNKEEIAKLAGEPQGLLDNLGIADRLAPLLASAPKIQGNPRIVKRLLNAVSLRQTLAANRKMNIDLATLAKLAIFERCTDGPATLALFHLIMDSKDAEKLLLPQARVRGKAPEVKGKAIDLPTDWAPYADFIEQWRELPPLFDSAEKLRPAVFLSRDVMAPALGRSDLSHAAREAIAALLKVDNVNSPVGKEIIKSLNATDRRAVMSGLIDGMRDADWSAAVPGIHGAALIAENSPEAKSELKAFVGGLQTDEMNKGVLYLLRKIGLIGGA
ncbi:P-loop NTPase fold protein [Kaistia dalseonensis]|uniref:KAP-like P-loop ATPase n=1 Tax=Kaistia dalseonensis TaxID=410840 RepID=A0ABU0HA91_9HYPH|nr:P-loop NTPase fold protein [Kaistia dalseonensis]MCX5496181.1 P-loop NTPase fold protein [Kaistia dalseonensis]MDQ0438793.1 putative KAP-like P-loop ATPase [Kaistia dalseonensis]